ncbi:MAG: putative toxin-antitoxin system toxin component, PIN family [Chitinivibrionales bacterium]|nr:putative toxin-antitoxin system toxin component, PIN family [Chitinivibrionales bacterium]
MGKLDIVLDTNVIFSGLYSQYGSSYTLLSEIGKGKFNVHVSVPLIFEYEDVLMRNQKELGLSVEEINEVLEFLCSVSNPHLLYYSWRPCLNDPDDEMLLELAIAANARFIVTHNIRHFKGIHGFNVRAIKPSEFLKLLEE